MEKQRKELGGNYSNQLMSQCNLTSGCYCYNDVQPSVYFFKELATTNHGPICNIPDTLIFNDKDGPMVHTFTGNDGKIHKNPNVNFKDYISLVSENTQEEDIVATQKKATYGEHFVTGNDVKLLNGQFVQNCSAHQIEQKQQVICLQKFIKSSGKRAYICRTVWKRNLHPQSFIVTSKKRFDEVDEQQNKRFTAKLNTDFSDVVRTSQGKHLVETSYYLKNIAEFFQMYRGKILNELVGDFIKDDNGAWWLINIRAFRLEQTINSSQLTQTRMIKKMESNRQSYEKQKYQKTKICRYCQKSYLQFELHYRMTTKMLIQTDRYLLHMGKNYKWLQRSDINNVDSHCLYQEHKICERCYRLYIEIQQLMEVEKQLVQKMGVDTQKTPKQLIQSSADSHELQLHSKNKEICHLESQIPEKIQLGPNSNIIIKDNCPIRNDKIINKMIRYRLIIYLKQFDQISEIKPSFNYYLEYTIMGIKQKIRLDTSLYNSDQRALPIRKMKSIYFFANSHEDLNEYANLTGSLVLNLIAQNKLIGERRTIGKLNLPLKEYLAIKRCRKDFYKMFNVENVPYGWGFEGSIGVIPSLDYVNTSRVVFSIEDKLIYVPNKDFYYCEALPQEWLDRIKLKPKEEQNLKIVFESRNSKMVRNQYSMLGASSNRTSYCRGSILYEQEKNPKQEELAIQSTNFLKDMLQTQILSYESRGAKTKKSSKTLAV